MVVLVQVLALLAALGLTTAHTTDHNASASPVVDDVFLPSGG
jgi:hypothetical protein